MNKKHTQQGQTDYHYDRTGRIESCRNQAYWETLQYDAAANLLDKRRNEDSSTDNQNLVRFNQLLHFRGLQYTYDAHGRTHSKQTASGTQYYSYDAEHRLTEVRIEKLNRTERYGYVYDALGRRIEKHQIDRAGKACNRTRFLWDGLRMIQETRTDRSKSIYIYTDESGYEPLARVETTTGTEQKVLYYHTDVNGAPEELTDEDGHIVWACSYQLWGKPIQEIEHSQIQQNLRYQGQYLDRETGLHYNTFRYYDPDIGRFTQPDPIGLLGGFNLYQYAPNSLMWIDPWGLACLPNKKAGMERERRARDVFERRYGKDNVLSERYLRDANGKSVKDPLTGERRRIDFIIKNQDGKWKAVEITSRPNVAKKNLQLAKEERIREQGGIFVKNKKTGELIHLDNLSTVSGVK